MSISSGSEVNIDNTYFENGYGSNGGAIYVSGTATLTITNNNFNYGYVMSQGGAIYGFVLNKIVIISCTFNDNYSEGDSRDLYLNSGTTEIANTNFYLLSGPSSIFVSTGNFSTSLLRFSNDFPELNEFYESTNGAAIFAENIEKCTIQSFNISNLNYAYFGGTIYFVVTMQKRKSIPSSPIYSISSCIFKNNTVLHDGGAIVLDYVNNADISSCTFIQNSENSNTSDYGHGGAIVYYSPDKHLMF